MVSVYMDRRSKQGLLDAIRLVKGAFPGWSEEQGSILMDRFAENGFTDQRMMDAVNHVIDTYEGWDKLPNIANFIQYDRQARLFRHSEQDALVNRGEASYQDFAIARIEGLSGCRSAEAAGKPPLYILRRDAEKYRIETRDFRPHAGWTD